MPFATRVFVSTPAGKMGQDQAILGLARARPALRFFDLFSVVCPDGKFQKDVAGVRDFRPDGLHFSPEASIWIADHYGKKMLDTGLH